MTTTSLIRPGAPRYDELRSGFNTAVEHRPAIVLDAAGPRDVVDAVALAGRSGEPVAVLNTGHGPSRGLTGGVLVRTGRMDRVEVDPRRRTALVEAGARWRDVIAAAAPHGLAPLNGTSPDVGVVGYTLGGGIGLLSRRFGFAADHVNRLDLVTADGRLRRVDAASHPDLFWAVRGAGANFGVVTALEIALFPVPQLYGGELCFGPEASEELVHAYPRWAAGVPETMASSIMLLPYPADPAVPEPLRGRHVTHVRLAYSGDDHAEARHLVDQLRQVGRPLVDSVRPMPYSDVGTIHHEPTGEPVSAYDRNILLRDLDEEATATLSAGCGPASGADLLVEMRAWGGALSRPPAVENAVGVRGAAFSLLAISGPAARSRRRRDDLLAAMRPWSSGMTYLNFCGVEDTSAEAVSRNYLPHDLERLRALKAAYDPGNTFRTGFTITPRPGPVASAEPPSCHEMA